MLRRRTAGAIFYIWYVCTLCCHAVCAVQAPLDFDDPRIAWSRNNQVVLQEKDQAEAASKQELLDKVCSDLLKGTQVTILLLNAGKSAAAYLNAGEPAAAYSNIGKAAAAAYLIAGKAEAAYLKAGEPAAAAYLNAGEAAAAAAAAYMTIEISNLAELWVLVVCMQGNQADHVHTWLYEWLFLYVVMDTSGTTRCVSSYRYSVQAGQGNGLQYRNPRSDCVCSEYADPCAVILGGCMLWCLQQHLLSYS
jgi:hypothetical protein